MRTRFRYSLAWIGKPNMRIITKEPVENSKKMEKEKETDPAGGNQKDKKVQPGVGCLYPLSSSLSSSRSCRRAGVVVVEPVLLDVGQIPPATTLT